MEKIIACCGIICSDCPTFNATKMNDDVERKRVADLWTKQYGHQFKAEDINCNGCLTEGPRIFNYCNICEIRRCGRERKVRNCLLSARVAVIVKAFQHRHCLPF